MTIYLPYTYLIKFLPTGQLYYGSSYANSKRKMANPEQLWKTYFTSSKTISDLIKEHGVESFQYEVRKVFKTKHDAVNWERRVLKTFNAKQNPLWLNRSNGGKTLGVSFHTEESKDKIRKSNTGKKHSEASKKKISDARKSSSVSVWPKGKPRGPHSRESNIKRSETLKRKPKPLKKYTKISYCCVCKTLIIGISGRPTKKTCSTQCFIDFQSLIQKSRINSKI